MRSILWRRRRAIEATLKQPAAFQAGLLRALLRQAAGTEWGRRHDYAHLARQEDVVRAFQKAVPLQRYDDLQDSIIRMRTGEPDVLWTGRVQTFAVSSGTTGERKQLPISDQMFDRMLDFALAVPAFLAAETGDMERFAGMAVTLVGGVHEDPDHPGVRLGEVSGLIADYWARTGGLLQRIACRAALPRSLQTISNLHEQLDAIVDYTMERDVRMLGMAPSWALVLLERLVERYNRKHHRSVCTVGEIWPNLGLFMSNAVPLGPYLESLKARIDLPGMAYRETYAASEAPLAFQCTGDDPSMTLFLDNGAFLEFVRRDEIEMEHPPRHTLADVQTGVHYVPHVSTCSGLWAYRLDDIIEFTGLTPPKVVVIGRLSETLDSYGERLLGAEAREALRTACAVTGARALAFHVVPLPATGGARHAHQWLVEFDVPPRELSLFMAAIDRKLQDLNPDYRVSRRLRGFGEPKMVALPAGLLLDGLKRRPGGVQTQSKVPCMSGRRELADGVLTLLDEKGAAVRGSRATAGPSSTG